MDWYPENTENRYELRRGVVIETPKPRGKHSKLAGDLAYELGAIFLQANQPYFIASGVIEGACRHLVKDRMDITGARWRLDRAEAVLKLRALRTSHDFDDYWEFHKAQEFKRNHADKFREPERLLGT